MPGTRSHRVSIAAASLAALSAAACATAPQTRLAIDDPGAVNAVIDGFVENGGFPLLYVRLEDKDGRVFYEHAAVNAALVDTDGVDGSSWFRIWSMSKLVTITVAMDLVEDGVLSLDDPVTDYIPEFADLAVAVGPDGRNLADASAGYYTDGDEEAAAFTCPLPTQPVADPMTVGDLIHHKAGFFYPLTGVACLDETLGGLDLPSARDSDELVARLATAPLIQQPGESYHYGVNTTVLGVVAERATGRSLKALVAERITEPLDIEGLQYGLPDDAELFARFTGRDGELREAAPEDLDIFGATLPQYDPALSLYLGGEGMVATTAAYADFARMILMRGALDGVRVLDEATVAEMTSPHTQIDSEWGYNGYNLWVNSGKRYDGSQGEGGLWIGGGYEGTHFWIDPNREFVGLVMSQILDPTEAGANRDDIIRAAVYEHLSGAE